MRTLLVLALCLLWPGISFATPTDEPAAAIRTLLEEGRHDDALEVLRSADGLAPGARALFTVRAHLGRDDWKTALEVARRASKNGPRDSRAQLALAEALRGKMDAGNPVTGLFSLGDYKKALARALELDPANVEARTEEIGYLTYAPGIAGGDKAKASLKIQELEAYDLRTALQMEVALARAMNDPEREIRAGWRLAELDPDDETVRLRLAQDLIGLDRYDESDPLLDQLQRSADRRTALGATFLLARSRILGRYEVEVGLRHLDSYVARLTPDPPPRLPTRAAAEWLRGQGLEQLGRETAARSAYRESLRRDPDFERSKEALRRLGK